MTSVALVPPKPKELDRAAATGRFFALWGTRSISVWTEGLSRFSVGGTMPSRIASVQKIASTAPAAPSKWPIDDLVEDIDNLPVALPYSRPTERSSISSPTGVDVP